jgi:hypothetical protein
MKKKTVLTYLYAAREQLDNAVLMAARSDEVSPRQRERIAFALRLNEDVVEDLKHREK